MKKIQKKIKEERGITLIALVVTIIILLILAGVAINMALGDNGLFKRSREAVNTWKRAEEDEQSVLGEIDSFLGDNIDNSKVKVEYNKRPMKIREDIICAINIDFTVTPKMDIEIKTEEEYNASLRELVIGKRDEELESILDTLLQSNQEFSTTPTLKDLYKSLGVTDLIGLANKSNIDEHAIENNGVNTIQEAVIAEVINSLINRNNEAIPFYQEKEGSLFKIGYNITPLNENIVRSGAPFVVLENGTYKFNVKILETGEEIQVEVPVTEIEQGTEYEEITDINRFCGGLKNKETGKYVTFEEAYAIYKGKIYDVKNSIENVDDEDIFNEEVENYEGEMYSYTDPMKMRPIIVNETGVRPNAFDHYTVIIIKDNKSYHIGLQIIPV